ncbi:hypothetical protein COO72_12460 [Bifidobacterium callitrichos]|nr:hypothetical protein COO72_12460 [Bifidobacterium callitrichos]
MPEASTGRARVRQRHPGVSFTPERIAYLESLDAVERADAHRITYKPAFKAACLRRSMAGEHPTSLFREAGLDPEIIGRSRIALAFRNWRRDADRILAATPETGMEPFRPAPLDAYPVDGETFTPQQVAYLGSLPAVAGVGPNRIRYTEGFRKACMRRYLKGAHPTDLFRKAGLGPEVVGKKRIERAFARWRAKTTTDLGDDPDDERFFPYGEPVETERGGVNRWRRQTGHHDLDTGMGLTDRRAPDMETLAHMVDRLARRNSLLRRENRILRQRLGLTADEPIDTDMDIHDTQKPTTENMRGTREEAYA